MYGNASGAKINAQKSEIMCIGSGCLPNDVKNDIEIPETNVMKILGIYFGKNKKECETGKIKYKTLYKHWICGGKDNLQFKGEQFTLLMSKLWYTLSVTSMPK